jgi:hypothetical protein
MILWTFPKPDIEKTVRILEEHDLQEKGRPS